MIEDPGWLGTLTGRRLLCEELQELRRILGRVFGDQLVQLGTWGGAGFFKRLARTRRAAVAAPVAAEGVDLVCVAEALAIASESVDAVLLPHALEFVDNPHAVLREVERILRTDGQLVILGFNPWGWWGCRHLLARHGFPSGARRMISDRRLQDWLRLLDFKVEHAAFYHLFLPQAPRSWGRAWRRLMARFGRNRQTGKRRGRRSLFRRLPFFAGCYVLVARKQRVLVTPIRMTWKRRMPVVGGLVEPTTRSETCTKL